MPPCGLVSFSTSPSMVFSPSSASRSSGVACAMVTPFDPPISGLRTRSTLVGRFSLGCLLLMIFLSKQGAGHRPCLPADAHDEGRARRRLRTRDCAAASDHPRSAFRYADAPWRSDARSPAHPDECLPWFSLKWTWQFLV